MADLPCPTCGSPLTFLDQYQRYYCGRCFQYAPEGYGDHGAQKCPTCGGILSYVRQYGRMYCYHCSAYPAEPSATSAPAEPATPTPPATEPAPAVTATPTAEPSVSASPGTVLVVPPSLPPEKPAEESVPEEIKPEPPTPEPVAQPTEPAKEPETPAPEPSPPAAPEEPATPVPSPEMRALAAQKPAAVRVKLFALKKSELIDLCAVYHLDTSGPKDQLQDRLLKHLHDLEAEGPAEPAPEPEEIPPVATPVVPTPSPSPVATASAPPAAIEKPAPAPVPAAAPAPVVVAPAPVAAETPRLVPRAEHPCPTCGRELTYIAQYNRSYCYSCQRYAPAGARARNACPTCGSTMRWIDQHRRWWCDSCQKYASADLPAPGAAAPAVAEAVHAAPVARVIAVHRHGTPVAGAGLVGFGIALYIVWAFFGFLGEAMNLVRPAGITTQTLDALQFFGFLFLALGAIVGLYGLRERE